MELSKAKQKIIDVSLDLFSTYGYEATSVNQIATALGIKKPSLYSHFTSKQEIFDVLVSQVTEYYEEHSMFAHTFPMQAEGPISIEQIADNVKSMITFVIHDPVISKVRKLMTIEQFQNPQLCEMMEKRSYQDILDFHTKMMQNLIDKGILRDENAQLMALQYMSPISMQLYRIDRNPKVEEEALELIHEHIQLFYKLYLK